MDVHDRFNIGLLCRSCRYAGLSTCCSNKTNKTALGYVGRILLHNNPWSNDGFEIQICCLIIAPAFIAAGIYLTLKHIVLEFGSDFSRLRPKYYTWIFILCDLFSLILQGAGGGIAATANKNVALQHTGNDLMMAGIVWQVFTLLVFGSLVADYASRAYQRRTELAPSAIKLFNTLRFKLFAGGLILTYLTVFTRCVFRIAEMAKGWKNPIMQDETDFIVLDGVMITIATLCLTVFHPGYCFPEMQMHGKTNPLAEFMAVDAEKVADPESNTPSLDGAEQPKSMDGKTNPQPEFMAADAEKGADRESNTPSLNGVEQPKS